MVFPISSTVPVQAYVLGDPARVIVDLPEVDFRMDPDVGELSGHDDRRRAPKALGGLVNSFRFGLFAPGKSRIVIDLAKPAKVAQATIESRKDGGLALVLELAATDAASFRAAAATPPPMAAPSPPPAAALVQGAAAAPVVVLDPGHGGVDTGALGPHGVAEKNITFAFANAVAAKLREDGQVRVVMTRTQDVFVPLGQRVRIARDANAALFMSIHADTITDASHVSGATVYTLSNKASDREAAREAVRENNADAAGGLDQETVKDEDEVKDILFDLTRRETRAYSNVFARTLMRDWRSAGALNHNPHRSAGFVVLKAPDVPSVLLELGYLSNRKDLSFLLNAEWREKAAGAVASAIEGFFASRRADVASRDAAAPESAPPTPTALRPSFEGVSPSVSSAGADRAQ